MQISNDYKQWLIDPYIFDFLQLAENYKERDIEIQLGVSEFNLEKILLENLKSSLPSIEELEEELRKMGS